MLWIKLFCFMGHYLTNVLAVVKKTFLSVCNVKQLHTEYVGHAVYKMETISDKLESLRTSSTLEKKF